MLSIVDNLDFKTFLNDKLRARGMSLKKLADLTGVPQTQLEHMCRGRYELLPAAPYLRGYLRTLGKILDFDHEVWMDWLAHIRVLKTSGGADELPRNRFAPRKAAQYWWVIALAVAAVLYVGFRYTKIIGRPSLAVLTPSENMVKIDYSPLVVAGTAPGSDEVRVNAELATLGTEGAWEKEIALTPGLNTIEVTAKKILGGETKVTRQVIYEPRPDAERLTPLPAVTSTPTPLPVTSTPTSSTTTVP
jgi:cytoskeletal protein RodZ